MGRHQPDSLTNGTDNSGRTSGSTRHRVPFAEAIRYWLRLGFINFGGPAGQIAIMHEELVDKKRWIGSGRFLHALNYCMILPGPEAQQLAIYIGWLLNGMAGGIIAGVLFVLPAFFLILCLSWIYAAHGDVTWVAALFYGLRSAVVALIAVAVIRIGSKALNNALKVCVAALAFVGIFVFAVAFPIIIIGAALVGFVVSRRAPLLFVSNANESSDRDSAIGDQDATVERPPSVMRAIRIILVGLVIWWGPLIAVIAILGSGAVPSREAVFFSQTAMVSFGGAYAVLAYINQAAVHHFGWLEPGQMVTGLGLAESTPGPLIMVTEFVGFLGAYRFPGELHPVAAGILGATVTAWATFAPCFLWIFLGAPYIERLRGNRGLNAALSTVTAAVVGVILNLAVTFAFIALFDAVRPYTVLGATVRLPVISTIDLFALILAVAGFVILWKRRAGVLWVVGLSAIAGLAYRVIGG
jgi:chromate transporter